MSQEKTFYKPIFRHLLPFGWKAGLILLLIFSLPRFYLVLQANKTGSYQWVSMVFVAMMLMPFLLLTRQGRQKIGWSKPRNMLVLLGSLLWGMLACSAIFALFYGLYGDSIANAFVYIARTYNQLPSPLDADSRLLFFLIFSLVSMTFSPIGEELFYRGIIHENFAETLGDQKAAYIDALAFALVHLAHFGLIVDQNTWHFLPIPALLWVTGLWFTCLLFNRMRRRSGSILGAILTHAGFNLAMNFFIFYFLLK
ncbi:MAG TPA: CPBP family intramembrane metalloprotease [Saprospiraceae bacterium]|nr:CPBP family intramembrane metalloprotease [Saprospiraceae bacterium]HMQ83918.1 CPBP family intramembrane metalloprotease [Saprospiraceae bacterium]